MEDKNKAHLEAAIRKEVTLMFESILDYTQVACPNPQVFSALRGKILRAGNNCIRKLSADLVHYEVKFLSDKEDLINFNRK